MNEWIIPTLAIGLITFGLIGQGFEMRKIRVSIKSDEELSTARIFTDKRNYKWYIIIGVGIVIWYLLVTFLNRLYRSALNTRLAYRK